jgi:probable 2-oxoglutarate dehydrogenase E1 component DHKTD1
VTHSRALQDAGVLTAEEAAIVRSDYRNRLEDALSSVDKFQPEANMLQAQWKTCVWPNSLKSDCDPATGVEIDVLKKVGQASVDIPAGFVSSALLLDIWMLDKCYRKSTLVCNDM